MPTSDGSHDNITSPCTLMLFDKICHIQRDKPSQGGESFLGVDYPGSPCRLCFVVIGDTFYRVLFTSKSCEWISVKFAGPTATMTRRLDIVHYAQNVENSSCGNFSSIGELVSVFKH